MQTKKDKALRSDNVDLSYQLSSNLDAAIKCAKASFLKRSQRNKSSRQWWAAINTERGGRRSDLCSLILQYDSIDSACDDINRNFCSRFTENIPLPQRPTPNTVWTCAQHERCLNVFDVLQLFKQLKLRSAPGPDRLPPWLYKHHGLMFAEAFAFFPQHLFEVRTFSS